MKPYEHAESSVKKFGGKEEDYLEIHKLLDSPKSIISDLRFRALTHHSWFIDSILPKIFGEFITNSNGNKVSVTDIGEQHCFEDFDGYIPSAQDYLSAIKYEEWMSGETPPQCYKNIDLLEVSKEINKDIGKHVVISN